MSPDDPGERASTASPTAEDQAALEGDNNSLSRMRRASGGDPVTPDELDQRTRQLDLEIRRLKTRNTSFRNKIFALQHAVVQTLGLTTIEIGHPAAEIFPIEVRRSPGAPVRIFAFGSMGANFGLPPKQFFNAFKDKDAEIIFFKDFRQCWYQQGLMGLTQNVHETIAYLRRLIAQDGRPVATVGASSGAFAAILFGAMIGAGKIVAFSPQTKVTARVFGRFKTEDSVIDEIDFEGEYTDLRRVLERNPLRGRVDLYYAQRTELDAAEANHLAGLPNVDLKPVPWHGHNTAHWLRNSKRLDGILEDLVTPDPALDGQWRETVAAARAESAANRSQP